MNDRNLVQNMTHQYDDVTKRTVILYRNATHPDRHERRGIIRVQKSNPNKKDLYRQYNKYIILYVGILYMHNLLSYIRISIVVQTDVVNIYIYNSYSYRASYRVYTHPLSCNWNGNIVWNNHHHLYSNTEDNLPLALPVCIL